MNIYVFIYDYQNTVSRMFKFSRIFSSSEVFCKITFLKNVTRFAGDNGDFSSMRQVFSVKKASEAVARRCSVKTLF